MEKIKIENFTFTYPQGTSAALNNICASVNCGEFIVLLGPSGSGKTTLLSQLKKEIRPAGESFGKITVNVDYVGYVGQNPHNQIVCDKVWHELAFGLENMGIKPFDIRAKVSEMATFFGIEKWFDKDTQKLSGGQKQILNLASVMVMDPDVLILDEPLSQLDPIAATDFLAIVKRVNEEVGTTIILSEHRLEETLQLADTVWMMDGGRLDVCSPEEIGEKLPFSYLPVPAKVFKALGEKVVPLTVKEGRAWLATKSINTAKVEKIQEKRDEIAVKIKGLYARYDEDVNVLNGVDAEINRGEIFGILGGNGSGKSTLLSVLCGIKKPYMGSVKVKGACAMLPQNCENLFVYKTVYEDLKEIVKEEETIKKYARFCGIEHLLHRRPGDLSGGECERAALCKILLTESDVVLLDEPTKGMDAEFKQDFEQILKALTEQKKTVVMVSHDVEFCARVCDRCALLFNGEFTSVDKTGDFFSKKAFYTTATNRMVRGIADELILLEELITALGTEVPEKEKTEKKQITVQTEKPTTKPEKKKASVNKYAALSYIGLLIAIPLTLLFGVYVLEDKKYYLMSLMVICEALAAFAVSFEKGKNNSRRIVMISALSAIAVAGRFIFAPFPEVKPVMAVIILTGATLGVEAGFLTGAVTAFVSNMFAGQGAWTPWQMFAMGVVGMISALIFKKVKPTKIALAIFGMVSSIAIYGLIMNPASLIMWNPEPTFDMLVSTIIAGIPYDAVLGVSTVVFLWLVSGVFIDVIKRIKVKYDI